MGCTAFTRSTPPLVSSWWPSPAENPELLAANWERALQDIADGKRHVNARGRCYPHSHYFMTLLHFAATSRNGGTVAHMRRLLELGANPSAKDQIGEVPMHCCVRAPTNEEDAALAKCKLLPVADIAANTVFDWTPFRLALFTNETVLRWMLEQPGCPVEDMLYAQTVALGPVVGENIWRLVEEAAAQRRRWTPNRAAWAATVAAAAVLQP